MDTIPRVTQRTLFERLTSIDEANKARVASVEKQLTEMDKIVSGNGVPGLNERVRVLESSWHEARNWMRFLAVAVIGDIVARIMGLI